jgi:ribonuclease BN (tRNA processing enzyme)
MARAVFCAALRPAHRETDIKVRMADEGRPALAPLVRPHEISQAGVVLRDGDLTITCARVHHPLVEAAFACRFDSPARSIVISGDTSPSPSLVTLARNADVLVHEVLYLPGVRARRRPWPTRYGARARRRTSRAR